MYNTHTYNTRPLSVATLALAYRRMMVLVLFIIFLASAAANKTGGGKQCDCTYDKCTPTCNLPFPKDCPENSNPCNCPPGSIVSEEGGKCVQRKECDPYINCKGDYNKRYTDCPFGCPSTCAKPNAEYCDARCGNLVCECKPGYILTEKNGKCIKPEECPGGGACKKNETFAYCSVACPDNYCPTDDNRFFIACDPPHPCPSGCSCLGGYRLKSENEKICILASDCPPVKCSRPNEEWNSCPGRCFSDNCRDRNKGTKPEDCGFYGSDCNPSCVCKKGFFRNGTDICVRPEECSPGSEEPPINPGNNGTNVPSIKCGLNEHLVPCKTICPPQSCDISYTSYTCAGEKTCTPGCDCIENHLRNKEGVCVLNENCPPPPWASKGPITIPPQPPTKPPGSTNSSNNQSTSQSESKANSSAHSSASSSSSSSESSSSSSSSSQSSSSSSSSNVTEGGGKRRDCTYDKCTPTCSLPFPKDCPENSNPCKCPPGSIVSEEGGKCVQRQECDQYINCEGDYNKTYTDCAIGCPSTCAKPNAEYCDARCDNLACVCKSGYILTEKNGKCIKPEECPGGGVCGKNETFTYCSVACPNNYCPTNDNRVFIACDPARPCPSGCICLGGYKLKSTNEKICILASDCPPVKCTRPNEEWNSCPGRCFSDNCRDRNKGTKPEDCGFYGSDCNPSCVCKKGFFRNGTDICVRPEECSPGSEEPPINPGNNGTNVPSIKCGLNEHLVPCKTICPPQSCDISYTSYTCAGEKTCTPGCDCIENHLRNKEGVCVLNENCPPPPWASKGPITIPPQPPTKPPGSTNSSNNQSTSQSESKANSSAHSSASNSSSSSESSSSSSSSSQSSSSSSSSNVTEGGEKLRDCTYDKCTPTCSFPFPKDCPENSNPCNCPPGSIVSKKGGKCVQRQECDQYTNCEDDYNKTYTDCAIGCPSTCAKPNAEYCDARCDNVACVCKPGYILTEKNGKCIKPEECPGGGVCGKNETFAYCSVACPNNYCPTNDNRFFLACSPPRPCPSGCSCLGGYRLKSTNEKICILASDCPPVKCTRPNEEWNSCPGRCFSDNCRDRNKGTKPEDCGFYGSDCNPHCVCKKGFFRNGTDICVRPEECSTEGNSY